MDSRLGREPPVENPLLLDSDGRAILPGSRLGSSGPTISIKVDASRRSSTGGGFAEIAEYPQQDLQVATPLRHTLAATNVRTLRNRFSQSGSMLATKSTTEEAIREYKAASQAAVHRTVSGMPHPTICRRWNWGAIAAYVIMLATLVFYFYVRIRYTFPRHYLGYSIFILVFEIIGSSNTLLQGLYLLRRKEYNYVPNETGRLPLSRAFHVRVMLPCYRESVELIQATAYACIRAELPAGCYRTVYICDDGKDPEKAEWVRTVNSPELVYVSGRVRAPGEINGKSGNLNNALTQIYPPNVEIPLDEVICVFDADQVAKEDFFVRTLQWMQDDKTSIVLTPQYFHNFNPKADIFNHKSAAYWDVILPGQDGFDTVCCTGSNFLLRAKHGAEVGWFPTFTMGEDVALALELQCQGHTSCYLHECLAIGEVPTDIRAICMQKSRWCKGGLQICFDGRKSPLLRPGLPLFQRILWTTGYWGYISNIFCTPIFYMVPVLGILFNIFPVNNSFWFALGFTLYIAMVQVISLWSLSPATQRALWFSNLANTNLWFVFAKATYSVLKSKILNRSVVFKATPKSAGGAKAKKKAKQPSATKDLWMPTLVLCILTGAFIIGIWRLVITGITRSSWNYSLIVSMLWCIYNAVPPYLMLQYSCFKEHGLQEAVKIAQLLVAIASLGVIAIIWWLRPEAYDYNTVLKKSVLFFEAQRSGVIDVASNRVPWRGSSGLSDYALGKDVVGGYYTTGDSFVKYSYPIATSVALLSWSLVEFKRGYRKAGEETHVREAIRWGADYLMKAHTAPGSFVAQVGNRLIDEPYWTRPEQVKELRPAYIVSGSQPGSDVVAAAAAALAATAVAFQGDDAYSSTLQGHAQELYQMATKNKGTYQGVVSASGNFISPYQSTSYLDDLAFAAIWLHRLTSSSTYLEDAKKYHQQHTSVYPTSGTPAYIYNWENSAPAVALLLAQATKYKVSNYVRQAESFLSAWLEGVPGNIQYTPRLLAWTAGGVPLQHAANAGFLAAVYGKHMGINSKHGCWAESQLRYMLGMRNNGRSFVVGIGTSPNRVTSRAASCPEDWSLECNTLTAKFNPGKESACTGRSFGGWARCQRQVPQRPEFTQQRCQHPQQCSIHWARRWLVGTARQSLAQLHC